ncbi:hypothetical protein [Kaistia terrae]|uniref:Uncharacterized protein n=1 Tax=Kaistia terrae TaxID=537017 RepID=A0ABW0Q3Y1_9HYPH|nr:hypothetical protein [Kaistia terrae]MCX5581476.1 hypothetical protein [Kaistia terrae]
MAEVISLTGAPLPTDADRDEALIATLERALERARSGETIATCIVELYRDETVSRSIIGNITSPLRLIGAVELVKMGLMDKALED